MLQSFVAYLLKVSKMHFLLYTVLVPMVVFKQLPDATSMRSQCDVFLLRCPKDVSGLLLVGIAGTNS